MPDIVQSTRAYEDWLRSRLGRAAITKDLDRKHEKMSESAFAFLRATYWRWAETVLDICPEVAAAPSVLSIGDIHLENFGTWRDADGRLVWGVNDYDEAAEMPYALDLVRLATSALLAHRAAAPAQRVSSAILTGYSRGLAGPKPTVLDRDHGWLLEQVAVSEKKRAKFWRKIEENKWSKAPITYRAALSAAMPGRRLAMKTAPRTAGAGSLGRPRWIALAEWCGGPVVREAKAVLPSVWLRARGDRATRVRCAELACGRYRASDPWYGISKGIVVRRLSPNNRKIEADDDPAILLSDRMLELMGFEVASVHMGIAKRAGAIKRDLARRKSGWLAGCASRMAASVEADRTAWVAAQKL